MNSTENIYRKTYAMHWTSGICGKEEIGEIQPFSVGVFYCLIGLVPTHFKDQSHLNRAPKESA